MNIKSQTCSYRVPFLPIPLLSLALAGLVVWYLSARVYYVIELHDSRSSAIWHDDEAFIFLGRSTSAKVARRYQVALQAIIGAFWYDFWPEKLQQDLMVFHINGDSLKRFYLKDFGSGGGAFPSGGKLYFSRGGASKDWPYVWQWSGSNFVRVGKSEALGLLNQFPPQGSLPHSVSEQIKREGWKELPWLRFSDGKPTPQSLLLNSRTLTVLPTHSEVLLQGRNGANSIEILSRIDAGAGYRQVSRQEYLKLKNR
jgi:hypothetical protein